MEIVYTRTECKRCDGTGTFYGANMRVHNGDCFTCEGRGRKLTRAGKAARDYFNAATKEAMSRRADEVQPGDVIRCKTRLYRVSGVHFDDLNPQFVNIVFDGKTQYAEGRRRDSTVTVWDTETALRIARETVERFPRGARVED